MGRGGSWWDHGPERRLLEAANHCVNSAIHETSNRLDGDSDLGRGRAYMPTRSLWPLYFLRLGVLTIGRAKLGHYGR